MDQEKPTVGIDLPQTEYPFLIVLMDKDARVGMTIHVSGPGVIDVPGMPEDGRPWTALTIKAREDYRT